MYMYIYTHTGILGDIVMYLSYIRIQLQHQISNSKEKSGFFGWLTGWGAELGDIPADNNRYLAIPAKIIFRDVQDCSCYCRMKAPQRIVHILHADEPEVGIRKE